VFYKEDCLHGIVHIQSRTAPMEVNRPRLCGQHKKAPE
jgi:hypothetical protein